MSYLYLDFETRSQVDLKKVGVHVYAHHPTTEIVCTGWALDDGEVQVAPGFDPELPFIYHKIVAHNAAFEREILAAQGLPLSWSCFIDTAALAARMALPRKLEAVAAALKLDEQKDMAGHRVMLKLARPKGGWDDDEFWEEEEKPADHAALREYCRQDVAVMREVHRRLLPLSSTEQRLYELTGEMNDHGVAADLASIPAAVEALEASSRADDAEFQALVGRPVKSYKKVAEALGLPNVKKVTVRNAIRDESLPPRTRRACELFKNLARSSPAKLQAIQRRASEDGRVRGALIYGGAERTTRWSSGGVQLHNLPKGLGEGTDTYFDALAAGCLDLCYDDVVGTTADALRGFLVGPFYVGDFAQIEARSLNWFSGEKAVLDLFAQKKDPYLFMASRIAGREVGKTETDPRFPTGVTWRFIGKTAVLGCFSADTLVLTDCGWKPIISVSNADKVWDGWEWVRHSGVVAQGEKEVVEWAGIRATPDHLVRCGPGWAPFSELADGSMILQRWARATGSCAWKASLPAPEAGSSRCSSPALVIERDGMRSTFGTSAEVVRHVATLAQKSKQPPPRTSSTGATPTSSPTSSTGRGSLTGLPRAFSDATILRAGRIHITVAGESLSTGRGGRTGLPSCATSSPCQDGIGPSSKSTESKSIEDTNQGTSALPRAARTLQTGGASQSCKHEPQSWSERCRAYDIAFAGPRNRFLVLSTEGPVVVHNCGYGLGWRKFQRQLDEVFDVQLGDDFCMRVVETYRATSRRVVAWWAKLESGFRYVVQQNATRHQVDERIHMGNVVVGGLRYTYIELPSGRRLYYAKPEMSADGVRYWGRNIYLGGKWDRVTTYGGKLAENVVQAFSRDVMAEAMLRLDAAGFPLLLTVHDEIIAEKHGLLSDFHDAMVVTPPWAEGLPIDVEVFETYRYRK